MSNGLPLEVLGMISPILCWVEGSVRPGLPDAWYSENYTNTERIRNWLIRELPTYSHDTLEEIASLAIDRRDSCLVRFHPLAKKNQKGVMAPPSSFNVIFMFHKLADHYFQWVGNTLRIREERMVELHELALRFPVRHLIRYCHADAVVRGYINMDRALELPVQMSKLHTTYQSLQTVVERGITEGHLHLNGVINADEAWAGQVLGQSSAVQGGFTPDAQRLLVLSRTVVRVLALGMLYAEMGIGCRRHLPFQIISHLDRIYKARSSIEDRNARIGINTVILEAFRMLEEKGQCEKKPMNLHWLMELANPGKLSKWTINPGVKVTFNPRGIRHKINLLKKLHLLVQRFLIERNVRNSFIDPQLERCILPSNEADKLKEKYRPICEFIHQVFLRYIIYHSHHWQKATQQGKTTGLRNFKLFMDSKQREFLSENNPEWEGLAVEQLAQVKPLRNVEGRRSPPKRGAVDFMPWLLAFACHADQGDLDKFGIVVHFLKEKTENNIESVKTKGFLNLRYGKNRRKVQKQAYKLFRMLSVPNSAVPFIVGIDAADQELATPPEVFAPTFRFLREYPIQLTHKATTKAAFGNYTQIENLVKKRRLGLTYHVGEDFRHLLSGLRAIREVIEFLKPLPGDRLGHALALALKPEVWAAQVGYQAIVPMQEWLDTLVWVHYFLGAGNDLIGLMAFEDRIQRYSKLIYGDSEFDNIEFDNPTGSEKKCRDISQDLTPPTLYDSWLLRQLDPYCIEKSHLNDNRFKIRNKGGSQAQKRWEDVQHKTLKEVNEFIGTDAAYRLVKLYWYSPKVRAKGREFVTIDMKQNKNLWLDLCHLVQNKLQKIVREKQLVVEVNPSSNRIIGPMGEMADHPIFSLTLDEKNRLSRQNRVTINSDDPGIFSTSLTHEFYLLGEILVNKGVPAPEVMEWLDWLRKSGKDYSFLRGLPKADNPAVKIILDDILKRNRKKIRRLEGKPLRYIPPKSKFAKKFVLQDELKQYNEKFRQLEAQIERQKKELDELKESTHNR